MLSQESELGKFLDPLADKVLVIATLIAFLFLDPLIPLWMIIIIIGRDVLITLMRYIAIKRGSELKTSRFGKIKTAFQMVSIIIIIMVFVVRRAGVQEFATDDIFKWRRVYEIAVSNTPDKWLIIAPYLLMAVVTILTALSGLRYIAYNMHLFMPVKHTSSDSAK
jgi:cardiolipin synthase